MGQSRSEGEGRSGSARPSSVVGRLSCWPGLLLDVSMATKLRLMLAKSKWLFNNIPMFIIQLLFSLIKFFVCA